MDDAVIMLKRVLGPLTCFSLAITLYLIAPQRPFSSEPIYWKVASYLALAFGILWTIRNVLRFRPRSCKECQRPLRLLDEEEDDEYLNDAELEEEGLNSIDYDVWHCDNCDSHIKLSWTNWFSSYSRCRECGYKTVEKSRTTVTRATRYSSGTDRITEACNNCPFINTYSVSTPRLSNDD